MSFLELGQSICSGEHPGFLHIFDFSTAPHLLYYSYVPIVVATLMIGTFVFINNRKSIQSRLLFSTSTLFALWVLNILIQWIASYHTVLMFAWQMTAFIEVSLYFCVAYFAYTFFYKRDIAFVWKLFFSAIPLAILALTPTTLNVLNYDVTNCEGNTGVLWNIIYALEPAIIVMTVILGLVAYRKEQDRSYKKQILLLTIGFAIFLTTFFLSNYYGEITKVYEFNFWGPLGLFFFITLLGYIIVRFQAFNVKLLGAQALVTATVLLIASEYFFVTNSVNYWLVSVTLLLTCIFGYFLVKSVQQEVRQRERIELLAKDLEAANKQQVTLIHFITHQLKGFVAKSRNIFAMIQEGDYGAVPDTMKPMIDEGFSSSTKGAQTIQDILNAANIKSGKTTYAMLSFDFKALIDGIVSTLKPNADAKNVAITVDEPAEPVMIMGDQMQLENAIKNMVDNTIKYTQQGSIKITLTNDGKTVRFMTKDTGVGITPEDMQRLFTEGGHGTESQKVNVDSTGFGLYIVKNIIEGHGGKVWAESEGAGKGSTFIVELPVTQPISAPGS